MKTKEDIEREIRVSMRKTADEIRARREYFAAAALTGILMQNPAVGFELAAKEAFEAADAMLKEGEK